MERLVQRVRNNVVTADPGTRRIEKRGVRFASEQLDQLRRRFASGRERGVAPNATAFAAAARALDLADDGALPTVRVGVVPTGGIRLRLFQGRRAATLDCLNDGLVIAIVSERSARPVMWPVSEDRALRNALHRISSFLYLAHTDATPSEP